MASIFSKIVAGDIPSHKIMEDDRFLAFLDVFPLREGHVLVIPKEEVDYMFDLDDDALADLHVFAKKVAKALIQAYPCKRIGTAVIGLEVPHAHLHLVPMDRMSDLDFTKEKLKLSNEVLAASAEKIRSFLD
ncbi:HIT family protein [Sediminitomix flava]|uniref:Histidine triad (HIT) family protein n=1 Tax=Sediminitomix flava TaxID=379075 RepID=A0A315Z678_SEDFL|nr:HIT family protein [Sediminitomix flava]PWJ38480.1 histidine triad (HIT) family protein [Sediminitomix flava]